MKNSLKAMMTSLLADPGTTSEVLRNFYAGLNIPDRTNQTIVTEVMQAPMVDPMTLYFIIVEMGQRERPWFTNLVMAHPLLTENGRKRQHIGQMEREYTNRAIAALLEHNEEGMRTWALNVLDEPDVIVRLIQNIDDLSDFDSHVLNERHRVMLAGKSIDRHYPHSVMNRFETDPSVWVRKTLAANVPMSSLSRQMTLASDDAFEVRAAVWSLGEALTEAAYAVLAPEFGADDTIETMLRHKGLDDRSLLSRWQR